MACWRNFITWKWFKRFHGNWHTLKIIKCWLIKGENLCTNIVTNISYTNKLDCNRSLIGLSHVSFISRFKSPWTDFTFIDKWYSLQKYNSKKWHELWNLRNLSKYYSIWVPEKLKKIKKLPTHNIIEKSFTKSIN